LVNFISSAFGLDTSTTPTVPTLPSTSGVIGP
jgi:hypothetical protein